MYKKEKHDDQDYNVNANVSGKYIYNLAVSLFKYFSVRLENFFKLIMSQKLIFEQPNWLTTLTCWSFYNSKLRQTNKNRLMEVTSSDVTPSDVIS